MTSKRKKRPTRDVLVRDVDTEAGRLLEARGAYRNLPSGYCDETDLLLMSQHVAEIIERNKKKSKAP